MFLSRPRGFDGGGLCDGRKVGEGEMKEGVRGDKKEREGERESVRER